MKEKKREGKEKNRSPTAPALSCSKKSQGKGQGEPTARKGIFDFAKRVKKRQKTTEEKSSVRIFKRSQQFIEQGLQWLFISPKNRTRRTTLMTIQPGKNGDWKVLRRENGNKWVECPICKQEFTGQGKAHHQKVQVRCN